MRAAVLLAVVLAGCGTGSILGGDDGSGADAANGGAPDAATGGDAAHQACVDYTNMYRTQAGHPAVVRSAELEAYADVGAMHDYSTSPHDHFSSTNGGGIAFAENECPHWDLSFGNGDLVMLVKACIDAFVSEGPGGGHYDNLMGAYGTLGCGIYLNGTDATIVQDYGQ